MIEVEKSNLQLSQVDYLHHISDLHIRNYKRHGEYNRVFEKLYASIRDNLGGNDLIVLTGDVVHSKTDVTPELFNEVQRFLGRLCEIAPVLMIPGNHDANLNNSHRLDALTPIVNAMKNSRLQYCKDTSIIRMGNVDFYHWSVFDDKDNYPLPFEDSQKKIALFHGEVKNASTEVGFTMNGGGVSVEDFRGFDLVLLGDIHNTQFLNPQKTIAYPGSLIQQNHGEGRKRGYLLWEVSSHLVQFIRVENDTAFYTIDIENGKYKALDEDLPKNLYLRVRYKSQDQFAVQKALDDVRNSRNIIELTSQKIGAFVEKKRSHSQNEMDFRSIEQQNKLISNFIKSKHALGDKEIEGVLAINEQVSKQLKRADTPRHTTWAPKLFEFENMFSYGKGNHVDFTDMKGTYGMFAPNASGKSTLLDSLIYCIFDKCTKTSRGQQVINVNSDTFYCKLNFELNGLDYYIERRAKKQTGGNVRVEVDFYYMDGGEKVSLNGKDRADTNNSIRALLGTYEDFVLTTLSTQTNNTGFVDMGQKDRKDLLSQFMDIGVFEELYELAIEGAKENAAILKHLKKTDYDSILSKTEKDLENLIQDLERQTLDKNQYEKEKVRLSKKIEELIKQLERVDPDVVDEEPLNKAVKTAKDKILQLGKQKQAATKEIQAISIDLEDLETRVAGVDENSLRDKIQECRLLWDNLNNVNLEVQKLSDHIAHKVEKMGRLNELEYDPDCKYCMGNIFVKDAIAAKEQISVDRQNLKKLEEKQKLLRIETAKCKAVDSIKESYEENKRELMRLRNKSTELSLQIEKINASIICEEATVKEYVNKLDSRKKQLALIKKNEATNKKIEDAKKDLKVLDAELKIASSALSDTNAQIKLAEKTISDVKKEVAKRNELDATTILQQYYLEATHRDGVPHDIISTTIPQIEDEVNNVLAQLVDFRVVFETDDKNINTYIAYGEDRYWPLELASGMEKFVSSLAIRNALINVSSLPRPNFIAIDEGFGSLDKGNLGAMSLLFEYLKTQFKFILVVSHIGSMRDVVDNHIEIHKVGERSAVKHG